MSTRNGFVLFLALSTLSFLAACGSSGNGNVQPPPSGGFSPSNFNGTYVFSTAGYNADGYFMAIAGSVAANGSRGITSGTVDVVTSDPTYGVFPNQSIIDAGYTLGTDGRGQITFSAPTNSGNTSFELDFVLSSNAHGVITEFDGNGTGSGTIDLQTSNIQPAGAFTFSLSGTGPGSGASSFGTVGSMTLGSGSVTAGVQDFNNGGSVTTAAPIATSSTVTVGSGTAPGAASLVTTLGTYAFDVYVIDGTHFKLIETDGQLITLGDAFTQATALPASATLTFAMAGSDTGGFPVGLAGFIPLDANSNVLSGGLEDFNDGSTETLGQDTSFGGGFTALAAGRSTLALTGFQNGATNDVAGNYTFAAYPFTSNGVTGMELLEIDNTNGAASVSSGVAYVQTGTTFAASQGYGLNLSAVNFSNVSGGGGLFEEDDIAEFSTTSTGFSGDVDFNDEGSLSYQQGISGGSYQAGGTGRYTATTSNAFNFNLYAVNDSTFLILETDSTQIGTGVVEIQGATTAPSGVPGIARPVSRAAAHMALRHR